MKNKLFINLSIFTLITIAFTLGFYNDFWKVAEQGTFRDPYDIYCQSQVIGRVIRSETNGIFSERGLNGWVRDDSIMKDMTWEDMTHFQYRIYTENIKLGPVNFIYYDSQIGGQAMLFAFLDKISPFSNSTNLNLFWIITSVSLALLMSVFVFWISKYYGLYASLIVFLFLLFSPMLTTMGNDLYLVLSSFFLPFIIMLLLLYYESIGKLKINQIKLFLISIALIFIKLFFSGYEFISTFLVMFTVPLFYYFFLNSWKLNLFIKRSLSVVLGAISAIILNAILYSYQLSTLKGNFMWGFKNMLSCFLRRSYGNSTDFPEVFKASLEANVPAVLKLYYSSPALGFDNRTLLHFDSFIIRLIAFSMLVFISKNISPTTFKNRQVNKALMLTTWISLLAPLSWFVIFKAHAFVHFYGYDDIVWCMPFALFGFALFGSICSSLITDIIIFFKSFLFSKKVSS
jgi:hypothetical protein